MPAKLVVNGAAVAVEQASGASLLTVLRDQLGLTGAKPGCGEGSCGACTVLVDGVPVRSCVTPAAEVAGRSVTTIEQLAAHGTLHPVQQAFVAAGAMQCGYCTPGMVLAATALLSGSPHVQDADVVAALDGNLCRCGTYQRIVRAVADAGSASGGPAEEAGAGRSGAAPLDPALPDAGRVDHLILLDGALAPSSIPAVGGALAETRPGAPWDLREPEERDWFDALGDGLVVVADNGGVGAWLHVGATGVATLFSGKVELGQGTGDTLARLVAAALAPRVRAVRAVLGDTDVCPWDMGTFGSQSTPRVGTAVRAAAHAAAVHLDRLAATAPEAGAGTAALAGSRVLLRVDAAAQSGRPAAAPGGAPPPDWAAPGRIAAVTGRRMFPTDVRRPGQLIGRVLRPPAPGARLTSVDTTAARALPGITVVAEGSFVGVVGADRDAVRAALAEVRAEWELPGGPPVTDLESYLRSHPVQREGWGGFVREEVGEPDDVLGRAPLRLAGTYRTAFLAHAAMETRVAVAEWSAGRLTAWTGTQMPFQARQQAAEAFGIPEEQVRIVVPRTGGGFGGKQTGDLVVEAARLARAVGRPVEVRWNRVEEFAGGHVRPAAVIDIRSASADGALVAFEMVDFNAGSAGFTFPYQVAHRRQVFQPTESPLAQGAYRALAATANTFARESHVDEVAHALGVDPLALRRIHLSDDRSRAVLSAAAERFGWDARRAPGGTGRGRGLAFGLEKGGRVATCAEVEVDDDGTVRVARVVTAFECGAVVDPDNLRNQIEGATMMGLGGALFEQQGYDGHGVSATSFRDYRVPRFRDLPVIEVVLLDRPDLPSAGGGETPIIALAPALANAVFAATGRRIRDLPLAPTARATRPAARRAP